MQMGLERALTDFTAAWEREIAQWETAMQTGETAAIESAMPDGIVCYFGHGGQELMEFNDRQAIIEGMRGSVAALKGCTKRFENRLIRMRSESEAVVFFEQVVARGVSRSWPASSPWRPTG